MRNAGSTENPVGGGSSVKEPKSVEEPKEEPKETHTHNWVAVYRTVHHDAVTHTEDKGYYQTETCMKWYVNGVEYSSEAAANEAQYELILADNGADTRIRTKTYEKKTWVPNIVTVVDSPAWDENVIDHYVCECGATK